MCDFINPQSYVLGIHGFAQVERLADALKLVLEFFEAGQNVVQIFSVRLEQVPFCKQLEQVIVLVAILDAGAEYVVMVDFISQILPIGFFVFPVPAEQTCCKYRGILVLLSVFLDFDKLINLLQEHVIGGDALGIFENTEQNTLGPAVMIREGFERRT